MSNSENSKAATGNIAGVLLIAATGATIIVCLVGAAMCWATSACS